MDLEEVVDGAEEVVEEVDGAEGEVRLPPVHGHALAWLGRLAPRLELRRARQLRREPHSDEGELPPRRGGDQHVHGATHEPHLHAVHAPAPPRRCQPAVQDDGHFRLDSDTSDPRNSGLVFYLLFLQEQVKDIIIIRRGMSLGFLIRLAISRVEIFKNFVVVSGQFRSGRITP